jgi:hypothetical protein
MPMRSGNAFLLKRPDSVSAPLIAEDQMENPPCEKNRRGEVNRQEQKSVISYEHNLLLFHGGRAVHPQRFRGGSFFG